MAAFASGPDTFPPIPTPEPESDMPPTIIIDDTVLQGTFGGTA